MNKVEKKATEIVQKAIKNKTFLDWDALVKLHYTDDVTTLVVVSVKGEAGKSTGIANVVADGLKNNDDYNAAWVRSTDTELKKSNVAATFTKSLKDHNFDLVNDWEVTSTGINKKVHRDNKRAVNLQRVAFADMNKVLNSGSQNALQCDLFVYDEFINPEFHKPDLAKDLYVLWDTYVRSKGGLLVLLANAHESANDIIIELGIEFDWESGKLQINYEKDTGILSIFMPHFENKYLEKAKKTARRIFKNSESVNSFMDGIVANHNARGVVAWKRVKDCFDPIYKYYCNDWEYVVGLVTDGEYKNKIYVKQLKLQEYPNLVTYSYHIRDKRHWNWLITGKNANLSSVRHLVGNFNRGNLIFSSDWASNEFINYILPLLRQLMDD